MHWNRVITVSDYWDGPKAGFAFQGKRLIAYKCLWDDAADNYSEWFAIKPVQFDLLPLIEESWSIWKKWERAFYSEATDKDTHPALPEDRPRHEELAAILDPLLAFEEAGCERVQAEFRLIEKKPKELQVRWTGQTGH